MFVDLQEIGLKLGVQCCVRGILSVPEIGQKSVCGGWFVLLFLPTNNRASVGWVFLQLIHHVIVEDPSVAELSLVVLDLLFVEVLVLHQDQQLPDLGGPEAGVEAILHDFESVETAVPSHPLAFLWLPLNVTAVLGLPGLLFGQVPALVFLAPVDVELERTKFLLALLRTVRAGHAVFGCEIDCGATFAAQVILIGLGKITSFVFGGVGNLGLGRRGGFLSLLTVPAPVADHADATIRLLAIGSTSVILVGFFPSFVHHVESSFDATVNKIRN